MQGYPAIARVDFEWEASMHPLLPGLKAALNYHPVFVHFPIALWLAALLFEVLAVWRSSDDMQRTAIRLLYLGTLAGGLTVLTGLSAEASVPGGAAKDVFELHEELMITTFSLSVGLCLFAFLARKNFTAMLRKLMLLGLVILGLLLTYGADRGAELVYGYGTGVNWPTAQPQGQLPAK
jgi:uncharacterized membrane protein